jgi:hypothetical protein
MGIFYIQGHFLRMRNEPACHRLQTSCTAGYILYNRLHPVQQATSCTAGYILYSRLHPVQQATSCSAGYILYSRLHPVQQATSCTAGQAGHFVAKKMIDVREKYSSRTLVQQ